MFDTSLGSVRAVSLRVSIVVALLGILGTVSLYSSDGATPTGVRAGVPSSATGHFVSDLIISGLAKPTDFAFAPDGRIFIAEKDGKVRIFENGALLAEPFLTLPANPAGERGLVGLTLDPGFPGNGYVYLYYTHENDPLNIAGPKTGRVIRVTADGNSPEPGSEVVLLGNVVGDAANPSCVNFPEGTDCIPADATHHVAGGLRFGPDGKLYVAVGDSTERESQELAFRALDVDSLAGKLLRINPDGSGPSDNPFYNGDPSANRSKVWAYGLRNPFRFEFDPTSGLPIIGDVGEGTWEEINLGVKGGNFGWPCYEGPDPIAPFSSNPYCQGLYSAGTVRHALYPYNHNGGFAAVIAGVFPESASYPPELQGAFFYADFVKETISAAHFGHSMSLVTFDESITSFKTGPEGDVYYVNLGAQSGIRRLRFESSSECVTMVPRFARATADPFVQTSGGAQGYNSEYADRNTGDLTSFAVTNAPSGSNGKVVSSARIIDNLYAGSAGTYTLTPTVDFDGGLYAGGGSGSTRGRLRLISIVTDASTGAIVDAETLRTHDLVGGSGLPNQTSQVHEQNQQLTATVTVPHAGMYLWSMVAVSEASATASGPAALSALAGWNVQLDQMIACRT